MMTQVEIANRSLDEIGKTNISTMAAATPSGDLVRRHFDSVIKRIVAEPSFWEFDKTVLLANDPLYVATTGTHLYRFNLPNRTTIKSVWDTNRTHITDRHIETDFLYHDISSCFLKYTIPNPTAIPEYIGQAMVYFLAAAMVKKGEGPGSRAELLRIGKSELSSARKISLTQKAPVTLGLDSPYSFIEARTSSVDSSPPNRFGP